MKLFFTVFSVNKVIRLRSVDITYFFMIKTQLKRAQNTPVVVLKSQNNFLMFKTTKLNGEKNTKDTIWSIQKDFLP